MIKAASFFCWLFFLAISVCEGQKVDSVYKVMKDHSLSKVRFRVDEQYRRAFKLYEAARIDTALRVLEGIKEHSNSFGVSSRDTKADVYRLAALSYLLLDSIDDARENIKKMLENRPFYKEDNVVDDDLPRFVDALDTLIASPQSYVGLKLGLNQSQMQIIKRYSLLNTDEQLDISQRLALNVGICAAWAISKHFSLAFEPEFFQSKSKLTSVTSLARWESLQTINYISLPVSFRANVFFNNRKTMPYLELGGYYSFLVGANQKIDNEEVPIDLFMKQTNYGLLLGAGFIQYFKKFGLGCNLRYQRNWGLSNDASKRYLSTQSSNDLMYRYFQLSNDVQLSSFVFSLMFVYNISYKVF